MSNKKSLTSKSDIIDLYDTYPISRLSLIKRSWKWLVIYLVSVIIVLIPNFISESSNPGSQVFFEIIGSISFYVFFLGLSIICLKLIYEEVFHGTFEYEIDSGNVVVASGVFAKTRSSFPLSRVNDIYLERDMVDFALGLYSINIVTANSSSSEHGIIHGLKKDNAVACQDYLTTLLNTIHLEDIEAVKTTELPQPHEV